MLGIPGLAARSAVAAFDPFATLGTQTGNPSTASGDAALVTETRDWAIDDGILAYGGWAQNATATSLSGITSTADPDPTFGTLLNAQGIDGSTSAGVSAALAVAAAAGSSDSLTLGLSVSVFNRSAGGIIIPGGAAIRQSTTGVRNDSGTSIALALAGAVLPTSLIVVIAARRGGGSEFTAPSGFAVVSNVSPGSQNRTTVWERGAFSAGGNGGNSATVAGIGNPAAAIMLELTRP